MSGIKITEKHHLRGYVLVNYNLRPYGERISFTGISQEVCLCFHKIISLEQWSLLHFHIAIHIP